MRSLRDVKLSNVPIHSYVLAARAASAPRGARKHRFLIELSIGGCSQVRTHEVPAETCDATFSMRGPDAYAAGGKKETTV